MNKGEKTKEQLVLFNLRQKKKGAVHVQKGRNLLGREGDRVSLDHPLVFWLEDNFRRGRV